MTENFRKPIPFRRHGRNDPELWACPECGTIYNDKQIAADCHGPRNCRYCDRPTSKPWTACEPCRERKKLEKAKVVLYDNVECDAVYSPDIQGEWGEGYSSCLAALKEACHDYGDPLPAYVHPCEPHCLKLDAERILENATDGMHDGAFDQVESGDELAEFLERWNAKQWATTYYPVHEQVIVLDQDRFDQLLEPPADAEATE